MTRQPGAEIRRAQREQYRKRRRRPEMFRQKLQKSRQVTAVRRDGMGRTSPFVGQPAQPAIQRAGQGGIVDLWERRVQSSGRYSHMRTTCSRTLARKSSSSVAWPESNRSGSRDPKQSSAGGVTEEIVRRTSASDRTSAAPGPKSSGIADDVAAQDSRRSRVHHGSIVPAGTTMRPFFADRCDLRIGRFDAQGDDIEIQDHRNVGGDGLDQFFKRLHREQRQDAFVHAALTLQIGPRRGHEVALLAGQVADFVAQAIDHRLLKIRDAVAQFAIRRLHGLEAFGMLDEEIRVVAQKFHDLRRGCAGRPLGIL